MPTTNRFIVHRGAGTRLFTSLVCDAAAPRKAVRRTLRDIA